VGGGRTKQNENNIMKKFKKRKKLKEFDIEVATE